MLFHFPTFVAFDVFILKRPRAISDYSSEILAKAEDVFMKMTPLQRDTLARNIIVVTQGFIDGVIMDGTKDYKQEFLEHLQHYDHIDKDDLRENLRYFLKEVLPVAEDVGIRMAIHPDDPPYPVLGLPRIVGSLNDIRWILSVSESPSHGFTFCAGSLSASRDNDLVSMAREFAPRTQFLHLRNTSWLDDDTFYESGHLEGDVDMYALMNIMLKEQHRRIKAGQPDSRMPLRPDHGIKILFDNQLATKPGYPFIGRLKGLAELTGMELAIERGIKNQDS